MTFVGVFGLLFALSAVYVANIKGSRSRFVVFVLLYVMHALAAVMYYFIAETTGSDAHLYFYDYMRVYQRTTGLGTLFVVNIVQYSREAFGGTFFDYFMIFQAFGFWGLVFLAKALNEVFDELEIEQPLLSYLPLFLPGLHYWTGAIGKDAPLFLGVSLAVWGCMRFNKRLPALGIAIMIMLAVRPHIAMVALISLGGAAILERRVKLWIKALMVVGIFAGSGVVITSLDTTYAINVASVESVSDFMSARSGVSEESGADLSIVQGNFPIKILSLWLRPFFLDAENLMGYVASMENVALLLIFAFLFKNYARLMRLSRQVLFVRFSVLFFIMLTGLLAAVNFNVGLGLRQKMMAMPCLLIVLGAVLAMRAGQRAAAPPRIEGYFPSRHMPAAAPRAD